MKSSHALEILFEDQWIIVVSKPSGMLSVGFPGNRGKTAEDVLSDMKRSRGKIRIGAVHRLDRDTSGVMMFACTAEAKKRIMDDWQDIVSERVYRCVCRRAEGSVPLPDSGKIDAPLAYNRNDVAYVPRSNDHKALKDAEKAITHFRVLERGDRYDLVECELETGRKNQIRAHMAHLGHPVAGDDVYGADALSKAAPDNIDRLALHARVLAFTHPFTGEQHRFEVPEPDSFAKLARGGKKAKSVGTASQAGNATSAGTASRAGKTRGAGADSSDGENAAPKIPRRQRGKPPREEREPKKERSVEDIDVRDLKPLPRPSRTKQKQTPGKSRFIPSK